jgi:dipeptidase E
VVSESFSQYQSFSASFLKGDKMNVLLTSAGFENPKIAEVFLGLVDKAPEDIRVVFIPTAANSAESIAMLPKCMNDLLSIGIKSDHILVYDLHFKLSYRILQTYDAVYLCGGSAEYLIKRVNKTGFRKVLLRYVRNNGIYVGVSAGSYIAANNVKHNLGLINKLLTVHCDTGEQAGPLDTDKENITLTNNQALLLKAAQEITVLE